jgi:glycosyltransferase involved in cell wall biosynthesis
VLAGRFDTPVLEARLRGLQGWNRVDYRGVLPRDAVVRMLAEVRLGLVLFHPRPNHVESQPNKLFEYMAAGLPVVASAFPLWQEIVEGAQCGLAVDPLDPRAIAEAIHWLLAHPAEAETMGHQGRAAVRDRFNWPREEATLLACYRRICPVDS